MASNILTQKPFDLAVCIGRFSPPHLGHKHLLEKAYEQADNVIVLIGSADKPRTIKNPFTVYERQLMLGSMLSRPEKYFFRGLQDFDYNDQKWAMNVQNTVDSAIETLNFSEDSSVCLVGNSKDDSSYYLKMFPQWPLVTTEFLVHGKEEIILSATQIRDVLFTVETNKSIEKIKDFVHPGVKAYLEEWMTTPEFSHLAGEYGYIRDYKKSFEKMPYPPTFVTVDAVVIQSGHVLLVKRRAAPGKGLYAIPGGFLNQTEYIEDGMIRELREETKLKVPDPVLRGSIKASKVFDKPDRSFRGRTITHAFLIKLPDGELPRVRGADDAEKAFWLPLGELKQNNMFEDHWSIIQSMVGMI